MRSSWVAVALFRALCRNFASGTTSGLGGVDRTHVIETSGKGGKEKGGGGERGGKDAPLWLLCIEPPQPLHSPRPYLHSPGLR